MAEKKPTEDITPTPAKPGVTVTVNPEGLLGSVSRRNQQMDDMMKELNEPIGTKKK